MKKLTLILFVAIAKIGFAQNNNSQQDTILVYSSPMYTKDPVRSNWSPVIKKVGEFFQVTFSDKKGVAQEVISFEDRDLSIRKGPYVRYQQGKLKEKGNYDKGHKNGEWITYFGNGDQVKKSENFAYGKLDGKVYEYWEGDNIQTDGTYENGRKIGEWKLYYRGSKLAGQEIYDVYGKKVEAAYFFSDGKPAKYEDLFGKASYKSGIQDFYKFVSSELRYPKELARDKIGGTVQLSFIITKEGRMEDLKVDKNPNDLLSEEALRVVRKSGPWEPAVSFGEKVSSRYNLPIKFSMR